MILLLEAVENVLNMLLTKFQGSSVTLKYFVIYFVAEAKVVHEGDLRRVVVLFEGKLIFIKPHIRIDRHVN